MDIGEIEKTIELEPVRDPVPAREREAEPEPERVKVPAEPEKVPA